MMNYRKLETLLHRCVFFGIPIGYTFWTSVGSIGKVYGISMQPTFNSDPVKNDWIFFDRRNKYNVSPGDVVILISPLNPNERLIKRVVAVNGTTGTGRSELNRELIPQGHIWVEGDNRKASIDSNSYGPVPIGLVLGKVKYILWPFNRFQAIEPCLTRHESS